MTDKIIIDGVDVSECYYFESKRNNDENFCRAFALPCDLGQKPCLNCFHKQLKCTQNQYNAVVEQNKSLQQELKRKEKGCEELENQLQAEQQRIEELQQEIFDLRTVSIMIEDNKYKHALKEIKQIATEGLEPICYKSNCSRCKCYQGDYANASLTALINSYFDENGEFADGNGDFVEALEGLLDDERSKCNKAQPICEQILQKCEVLDD